jgi:hypothetical protein
MPCAPDDVLCRAGDLFLPKPVRKALETYIIGDDTTLVYVTYWTVLHFMSGILVAYLGGSYVTGFWIHTAWEVFQIGVRNTPVHTLRGRVDIVTDTVFFMLGMVLFKTKR